MTEELRSNPIGLKVYVSSMSSSRDIKTKQQRVLGVLESKKIAFEKVDIATNSLGRTVMRRLCQSQNAMPPIIAKGDVYLGDYQTFIDAVDDEIIDKFLQLT